MPLTKIKSIRARKIIDSRANFTLEVEVATDGGRYVAGAPAGASRGKYEAVAIEIDAAIENVNKRIAPELKGKDPAQQVEIDRLLIDLDGTSNKANLGGNAIAAVSMAICKTGAGTKSMPLWKHIAETCKTKPAMPLPAFNIVEGGAHAGTALVFQEFMAIVALGKAVRLYGTLKEVIAGRYGKMAVNVGDEGGFAPPLSFPEEAIELILTAASKIGLREKIKIAIDVAASQFYKNGKYKTNMGTFTQEGLMNYYAELIKKYPIISIEDPFHEEDWQGFAKMTDKFGKKISIIGDDLLVTNPKRIREAKEKNACNGVIVKINQIGTVSEAAEAANLAKSAGWKVIVSHRSGETNDDFIADLAVGLGADFIKAGAPARGERVAKYNRLLKIEEEFNV